MLNVVSYIGYWFAEIGGGESIMSDVWNDWFDAAVQIDREKL